MSGRDSVERIHEMCEDGHCFDALKLADRELQREPKDPDLHAGRAEAALRCNELDTALEAATRALELSPDDAESELLLATVLLYLGRVADADVHLARAAQLDPEHFVVPHRITSAEFDAIAAAVVAELPDGLAKLLDDRGTAISVQPLPRLDPPETDPHILGCYFSNPLGLPWAFSAERGVGIQNEPPDAVEIYQLIIETWCPDEATLRREIRTTVLHELGHAFGMEHAELDEDGL